MTFRNYMILTGPGLFVLAVVLLTILALFALVVMP